MGRMAHWLRITGALASLPLGDANPWLRPGLADRGEHIRQAGRTDPPERPACLIRTGEPMVPPFAPSFGVESGVRPPGLPPGEAGLRHDRLGTRRGLANAFGETKKRGLTPFVAPR
jgi:hypothetical protein